MKLYPKTTKECEYFVPSDEYGWSGVAAWRTVGHQLMYCLQIGYLHNALAQCPAHSPGQLNETELLCGVSAQSFEVLSLYTALPTPVNIHESTTSPLLWLELIP